MLFYEKLSFLMSLTQTTNRMLARELRVDPSLISRLRRGNRGIPRNREHIKAMARFFSRHCVTEYQRQAVSEMLGIKQAFTMKREHLSDILYYWLCDETDTPGQFMRTFESFGIENTDTPAAEPCRLSTDNSVYYGTEGKRASARALYLHLLSLESPSSLYLFTDEADTWITEEYEFSAQLQSWGMELIRRGFKIYQIMPPSNWVEQAFDSLFRWFPLYMTGQVSAYYYPRIRDNVHRRTIIVVPGEIAVTSNSVSVTSGSYVSLLTTDQRLTQIYASQFQDLLSLCQPMLDTHTLPDDLMQCFTRFISADGARIQQLPSLSAETAPPEVMEYCLKRIQEPDLKILGQLYQQEMKFIEEKWVKYGLIDIARLANADEVRKGNVPVIFSIGEKYELVYYTPELYILHLQNILRLLEVCENYHFIPLPDAMPDDGSMMVREGQSALLLHTNAPFTVFEITQPDSLLFCREHLLRIAERAGYTGIGRIKTISRIKELIRELQQ